MNLPTEPTSFEVLLLSLFILVLGGTSISLGRSAALLANQIRPRRFIFALIGEGVLFTVGVLVWALTIFAVLNFVFAVPATLVQLVVLVAIGYSPYIFGFLVFLPYLGNIWHKILRLLVFFTILILVGIIYNLTFWQALLACGLGGLLLELVVRLQLFNPTVWQERLLRRTTGKSELLTATELADRLAEEIRIENYRTGEGAE